MVNRKINLLFHLATMVQTSQKELQKSNLENSPKISLQKKKTFHQSKNLNTFNNQNKNQKTRSHNIPSNRRPKASMRKHPITKDISQDPKAHLGTGLEQRKIRSTEIVIILIYKGIFPVQSSATLQKSILVYSMPKANRFRNGPAYQGEPSYYVDTCFKPNPRKGAGFGFGNKREFPEWM